MLRAEAQPQCGLAAMVSASKDGASSPHPRIFKVQPSPARPAAGRQAFAGADDWAERGFDLGHHAGWTRGPCYVVQHGVTSLAQIAVLPIFLLLSLEWNCVQEAGIDFRFTALFALRNDFRKNPFAFG